MTKNYLTLTITTVYDQTKINMKEKFIKKISGAPYNILPFRNQTDQVHQMLNDPFYGYLFYHGDFTKNNKRKGLFNLSQIKVRVKDNPRSFCKKEKCQKCKGTTCQQIEKYDKKSTNQLARNLQLVMFGDFQSQVLQLLLMKKLCDELLEIQCLPVVVIKTLEVDLILN